MFNLLKLFSQPYALNPAPNRTLQKVGFKYLKTYETTPSWINFRQPVTLWLLNMALSGRFEMGGCWMRFHDLAGEYGPFRAS